jgi:hypothetical protein
MSFKYGTRSVSAQYTCGGSGGLNTAANGSTLFVLSFSDSIRSTSVLSALVSWKNRSQLETAPDSQRGILLFDISEI